jgi:cytochrome c-type biogenesis protein
MNQEINITSAFLAGVISFLSPCVLPLIPAYLSYLTGIGIEQMKQAGEKPPLKLTLPPAISFVLGFSTIFILLGATASVVGKWLIAYMGIWQKIAGVFLVILGLHLTGILRLKFLMMEERIQVKINKLNLLNSYLVGMAFGFGWTPCVGPLLAGILALAATQQTIGQGILLLAAYSLGIGIPFLAAAALMGPFIQWLNRFKKYLQWVEIGAGVLLLILGVLMFFGGLTRLSGLFRIFGRFAL